MDPGMLVSSRPVDLDRILRSAHRVGLLSRLAVMADEAGLHPRLDPRIADRLVAARMRAEQHERVLRWEVNRVRRAFRSTGIRTILLKGAAYALAELPARRGRLASDLDILVPREKLDAAEQALLRSGWETTKPDPYDQRYYRRWMHELPPLQHRERRSLLDVHHTIAPLTGRLSPDADKILGAASRLDEEDLWVLSPEDMWLHSATHLFQDEELSGGLRDLIDLDDLFRDFGRTQPCFLERLPTRAAELGLGRPMFYALRYCRRLLRTPVPEALCRSARCWRPPTPVRALMDGLVVRALTGDLRERQVPGTGLSQWLLYVRGHWLRMPFWLLAPHLTRKAWRGLFSARS